MNEQRDREIHLIPLEQIAVVNPRDRGQRKFRQITDNIAMLGLKKPFAKKIAVASAIPKTPSGN